MNTRQCTKFARRLTQVWSRRSTPAGATPSPASYITVMPGRQYLSMRYTDRLVDAGIAPSVGSQGDAYDCEHDGVAVRAGLTPAYE